MSSSRARLAYDFAEKASVNAEFVVAAVKGMGRGALAIRGTIPTMGLQPANQLIAEGIELLLKAMVLARGGRPKAMHDLVVLFDSLQEEDKGTVETVVHDALARSSTGPVPYGLPNVASAVLVGAAPLGEPDPTAGYGKMNAREFLRVIYAEWAAQRSQYLGADAQFEAGTTLRASTRLLAGAIMLCERLAKACVEEFRDGSVWRVGRDPEQA